jgi:hypothetical protein
LMTSQFPPPFPLLAYTQKKNKKKIQMDYVCTAKNFSRQT